MDNENLESKIYTLLDELSEAVEVMESIMRVGENEFLRSKELRYALRYSIVLAVEVSCDIGLIILKEFFNKEARGYRDVFMKLAEVGVLKADVALRMASLASLRNMVVHRYWGVDDLRIYSEAKRSGVGVIKEFINEVKRYVFKEA